MSTILQLSRVSGQGVKYDKYDICRICENFEHAPSPLHAMKKILIVEDHADIRRLIRMTLEFEGCEIHDAPDAPTGWDRVRELQPNAVLLDVMMPGALNGLDLCRAIKADGRLRRIPVVILSARGSAADREAGMLAGADAYLLKPFSPMQLLDLLSRLGVTES
jgi:CheY-like chemotaxis protein